MKVTSCILLWLALPATACTKSAPLTTKGQPKPFGGTPLSQIAWIRNRRYIQLNDRDIQENYGKSLVIKHVGFEVEGTYTCEATKGVGDALSHSIHVEVQAVPYFRTERGDQRADEDDTVFRCEANEAPEPQIIWIYKATPITEVQLNLQRSNPQNKVIIVNASSKDIGNYGCNASNTLAYVHKDVCLYVLALVPQIREPPSDMLVFHGQTVRFTCRAFGDPEPDVKWIRNGEELTGGKYKVLFTGDLEIENVDFTDTGKYTCNARNKFGKVEATARLLVKEHTMITNAPEDCEVVAGAIATFRCSAVTDLSLTLVIDWLRNGEAINFVKERRFIHNSDYSLSITETTDLDSGTYTCVARTEYDEAKAQASLTVQDVPNSPELGRVSCRYRGAVVEWRPLRDNRAPILRYTVQHNTSFTPDTWDVSRDYISAADRATLVPMSPWANYTFRVIAWNKIGPSRASAHSSVVCTTRPEVPYENPDNVMGKGTEPTNLVITWTVMPQIKHNAPRFMYRVYYKRDVPGENWKIEDISDWKINRLVVDHQQTYQRYRIKISAINEKGECRTQPSEVVGYSGEDVPLQAPGNFTLMQVNSSTNAIVSWSPVPLESVRGDLVGYKIQTWTDRVGDGVVQEIMVRGANTNRTLVTNFAPFSKNYVRILVYNRRYNGPPSETLSFDTTEGVPGTVLSLDASPMGSSAFFLTWTKPAEPNGNLTGYRIYYQVVNGSRLEPKLERKPRIKNPAAVSAKLVGLHPETKYRIHIRVTTNTSEGNNRFIERVTRGSQKPDEPIFTWRVIPQESGNATVRLTWEPNYNGHPGNHFFARYKLRGETFALQTDPEYLSHELQIIDLLNGETYTLTVVAVDGDFLTESEPQDIEIKIEGTITQILENDATIGWFIGMMSAIFFLLFVLIIVSVMKRNRGGSWSVPEMVFGTVRDDYKDEGRFYECPQILDTESEGERASTASSAHHNCRHPESDTDSMTEYEEVDAERMNEDGSFNGQYGQKEPKTNSQTFARLV